MIGRLHYHFKRILRTGIRAEYNQKFRYKQILNASPQACDPTSGYTLHSVIGKEQLDLFVCMLSSFLHHSSLVWNVILHDDGSMSLDDISALFQRFPDIQIIPRKSANEQLFANISEYKRLHEYRKGMPHALKCVDTFLLGNSTKFLLLDPDIIFFRKPDFIDNWIQNSEDLTNWFNQDPQEPSPFTTKTSIEAFGFPIWSRVNSGVCLINRDLLDLDFMESCFHNEIYVLSKDWRKEQTLFALLASRKNQGGLLPKTYEVSLGENRDPNSICRHYVGSVRHLFWKEGLTDFLRSKG